MEKETVLLGLSGGVDSAAAAILLKQQGYRVIGATMLIWDPSLPVPAGVYQKNACLSPEKEDTREIEALAAKLRAVRAAELRAGFCLAGPHREDLEILLDGQPGKIYGSQGQQRSAVLAMKLAEATVAGDVLGEHPVMLLDDVLSELDDARQTYLLTRIEDKQTFVTTCDSAAFARTNGKIVHVKGGEVWEDGGQ